MKRVYLAVFAVALATRLVAAARVAILDRDGVQYLACAGKLARGDLEGALAHHYPPAYPFLVAAAERAGLDPEPSGLAVSAVAGALGAVLGAAVAARTGRRTAWVAGLTVALHPGSVELGAAVLPDALFATLLMGALWFGGGINAKEPRSQGVSWGLSVAGALAALSYLARPEGLVVLALLALRTIVGHLLARPLRPLRLGGDLFLLLAPALLIALPYVVAIKKDPALTGGQAGEWKLTKKRELFLEAGGEKVFPRGPEGRSFSPSGAAEVLEQTAERLPWQLYKLGYSLKELAAVFLVLLAIRRRGPRGVPDLDAVLSLLLVYSLIRVDERYGKIAATLLLPWLGAWLAALGGEKGLLAVALLVPLLPATRERHTVKVRWKEAGIACRGLEKIASTDPRVAFYAGAEHIDLNVVSEEEARREGAQAIVIRDPDEEKGARVEAVKIVRVQ